MIKNCLIHTQQTTQQAFQKAILKAIELCPNFRYHTIEEQFFGEKDLENLMLLIKKPAVMREFCSILFNQLLRLIAKQFQQHPNAIKWQLIESKIVNLVLRLSHFDNRGLLLRYCLLRHFELDKVLNPNLITA